MSRVTRSGHGGHSGRSHRRRQRIRRWIADALARRTDIILLENDRNLGFAAAVNQAYERSSGELVLLLNSDVGLAAQALHSMMAFLDDHPTIAGVAPLYVFPDGSPQPFHFRFPTFSVTLANCSAIARRFVPGIDSSIAGVPDARRRFLARSTCASAVGELSAASPIGASRRPHFRRALSDLLQRRPACAVIGGAGTRSLGNARCHGRPRGRCLDANARDNREAAIPWLHYPNARPKPSRARRVWAVSRCRLRATRSTVDPRSTEHDRRQAAVDGPVGRCRVTPHSAHRESRMMRVVTML